MKIKTILLILMFTSSLLPLATANFIRESAKTEVRLGKLSSTRSFFELCIDSTKLCLFEDAGENLSWW